MAFSKLSGFSVAKLDRIRGRRSAPLRRRGTVHLRGLGAAGLLLAVVGSVALIAPQAASADTPHAAPAPQGVPSTQSHDLAGFPGTNATAPFNECPQIGYDASCGILIVISNNGEQVLQDPNNTVPAFDSTNANPGSQNPYDTGDDTLVGIVNESSKPVYGLQLSGESSGTDLFGFDGDGICTYATGGSDAQGPSSPGDGDAFVGGAGEPPAGYTGDSYCNASQLAGSAGPNGADPNGTDYEGPNNTFSNISADETSGDVNFTNGVNPGQSTYFSLEESLEPNQVSVEFGYWMAASDGGIFAYDAPFFGSMGGKPLNKPIVGITADPKTGGYWEVASDGGLFAFNAPFFGSMGGKPLNAPVVGMVATPDGGGYWEVASDGGVFNFGDASLYGSMGGKHLNAPVVGIASSQDGLGYYEVASDGGIFNFGDAHFYGSMGGQHLNKPVVGITGDQATGGYWEVASDGGLFSFNAPFYGSPAATPLNKPVVGMAGTPDGQGYWEAATDGGIFNYGDAFFWGSLGSTVLNAPVVGIAGSST
jgi:hypothetical protein